MTDASFRDLEGLRALVTGGASGIGAATATELAQRGAAVACLDLVPDQVPAPAIGIRGDVTDDASVVAAVDESLQRLGGLDIVVNNAGTGAVGTIADNDDNEWRRVYDVNVLGLVRTTRAALAALAASNHASVVNVGSIAASAGLPQRALYAATKGAVQALTLAMAADHAHQGIRVNCVNPGTVDTPWVQRLLAAAENPEAARLALIGRQPIGRLVRSDEVAFAVAQLASPRSGATTGTAVWVDGGIQGLRLSKETAR